MNLLSKSHKIVKAKDLNYGDIVRLLGYDNTINNNPYFVSGGFQDLTVVQINGNEITFARPHVVLNEHEIGFSISTEIFIVYDSSPHDYLLIDNHFHPDIGAQMCDEIRNIITLKKNNNEPPKELINEIEKILTYGPNKKKE